MVLRRTRFTMRFKQNIIDLIKVECEFITAICTRTQWTQVTRPSTRDFYAPGMLQASRDSAIWISSMNWYLADGKGHHKFPAFYRTALTHSSAENDRTRGSWINWHHRKETVGGMCGINKARKPCHVELESTIRCTALNLKGIDVKNHFFL